MAAKGQTVRVWAPSHRIRTTPLCCSPASVRQTPPLTRTEPLISVHDEQNPAGSVNVLKTKALQILESCDANHQEAKKTVNHVSKCLQQISHTHLVCVWVYSLDMNKIQMIYDLSAEIHQPQICLWSENIKSDELKGWNSGTIEAVRCLWAVCVSLTTWCVGFGHVQSEPSNVPQFSSPPLITHLFHARPPSGDESTRLTGAVRRKHAWTWFYSGRLLRNQTSDASDSAAETRDNLLDSNNSTWVVLVI